jgi:hypothetical protein
MRVPGPRALRLGRAARRCGRVVTASAPALQSAGAGKVVVPGMTAGQLDANASGPPGGMIEAQLERFGDPGRRSRHPGRIVGGQGGLPPQAAAPEQRLHRAERHTEALGDRARREVRHGREVVNLLPYRKRKRSGHGGTSRERPGRGSSHSIGKASAVAQTPCRDFAQTPVGISRRTYCRVTDSPRWRVLKLRSTFVSVRSWERKETPSPRSGRPVE